MVWTVLFYVQNLLGIGHIHRAARISRALCQQGARVFVAFGGVPLEQMDFGHTAQILQLPFIYAQDSRFTQFQTSQGGVPDQEWRQTRMTLLQKWFTSLCPDVLLVETYPFGRRLFRFELEPLLQTVQRTRPRPFVACSVRDILVQKKELQRLVEMVFVVRKYFDCILVHGDTAVIPFSETFPLTPRIADKIIYTGYVSSEVSVVPRLQQSNKEIIVSVGGGAVGKALLDTACQAARILTYPWRILTGPHLPQSDFLALQKQLPYNVCIERYRSDFVCLLRHCLVSVSQGGYNTIIDILQARCRAIVVPFAEGMETEQTVRARFFAQKGVLTMIEPQHLSVDLLVQTIQSLIEKPLSCPFVVSLAGAEYTASFLRRQGGRSEVMIGKEGVYV